MNGLYNALFGEHDKSDMLLKILGITREEVPRYRSCYWDGTHIVIHTRTGGGNREEYEDANDELTALPGYVRDSDDDFDSTYANFFYLPPDSAAEHLKAMAVDTAPAEQWKNLFEAMKSGEVTPKAKAVGEQLVKAIENAPSGAIIHIGDGGIEIK